MQQLSTRRIARFGSFEADFRERKLTKAGSRVRLQEQPFRILELLLERPGQLVTRDKISRIRRGVTLAYRTTADMCHPVNTVVFQACCQNQAFSQVCAFVSPF